MCHVIVTCRSMLWTLLSIAAAFSELIAFLSTDWLVGFPRVPDSASEATSEAYRPTLGLFGRCVFVGRVMCGPYALTFSEIASGFWKAAAIFLATGILLLSAVAFTSIFTICFQSIMRKSIFNVCGLLQGIAGTQTITYARTHTHTHNYTFYTPRGLKTQSSRGQVTGGSCPLGSMLTWKMFSDVQGNRVLWIHHSEYSR